MTVAENIKRIRKEKGLTQKQLGLKCGMAESTVRQYELGLRNPKIETLDKIASALGIPIAQIKEDITLPEWRATKDYENSMILSDAGQSVRSLLRFLYGNFIEKKVESDTEECIYYLIGEGKDAFFLYYEDIDKLLNYIGTSLPLIVNEIKVNSEAIVIKELSETLKTENDMRKHIAFPKNISGQWLAKFLGYSEEEPPQE